MGRVICSVDLELKLTGITEQLKIVILMVIKRCVVPDFSIAEAKSQFAHLVNQAESGKAVRITRRGRPVAVLMSEAEYERLSAPREGLLAFTAALRSQAAASGIPLFGDAELDGLRDQSERPVPDLA